MTRDLSAQARYLSDLRERDRPTGITRTGQSVFHADPSRTVVSMADVVPALSRLYRYNGALNWTVLQHLVLCVELLDHEDPWNERPSLGELDRELVGRYVAAHDVHEAYVGDLVTGLKQLLPGWREIEAAWEGHVHRALGLAWPVPEDIAQVVKRIDVTALAVEMRTLGHPAVWKYAPPIVLSPEHASRVGRILVAHYGTLEAALRRALHVYEAPEAPGGFRVRETP